MSATPRGLLAAAVTVAVTVFMVSAVPVDPAAFVVSTPALPSSTTFKPPTEAADESSAGASPTGGRPDVYSLHVTSHIKHRYARTVVSSRLANRAKQAQEAQFSLVLPETAFISAFLIETEGKVYEAYVKEKEEAKKEYDAALASGQTAAHVAVSARDSNMFTVSVNVSPGQKVTFNLTYEELLARRLGAYVHAVHVAPGQIVRDLRVETEVEESRNLTALRPAAFLAADAQPEATENEAEQRPLPPGATAWERLGPGRARFVFAPTPDQQKEIAATLAAAAGDSDAWTSSQGLAGQLVVQYDVEREGPGGEVLLAQGYFVHFFAPTDLPPLPKHVVFVLDVSGSMEGRKVEQLKDAMTTILADLKPGDYFNLLEFSYSVTVWNLDSASNNVVYSPYSHHGGGEDKPSTEPPAPAAYPATPEYVQKAKDIVQRMTAGGGTNIHDALRTALAVARHGLDNATGIPADGPRPEPIVVFLTDGEPTVGESRPHKIFQMVSERNENPTAALYSLAFGDDADLPFLKKLSLRNSGFARKIYEAADAALQLRSFYKQVASPLLSNVTFEYTAESVNSTGVTKRRFPTYFAGSELVVAGQLAPRAAAADESVAGAVVAHGSAGEQRYAVPIPFLIFPPPPPPPKEEGPGSRKDAPSLERLWAYLSIRQLLDEREANSGFEDSFAPKANLSEVEQQARDKAQAAKDKALKLALQYSFVTPLTSLVVVKPNSTSDANLEDARRPGGHYPGAPYHGALASSFPASAAAFGAGASFSGGAAFARPGLPGIPPPAPMGFYPSTTVRHPMLATRPPYSTAAPVAASAEESASTPAPAPAPALGTLSDLAWLTNALNGTTGSLLVPLANGTRLLRLGVSQENKPHDECTLPEGASTGAGTAHCRHLPHCVLPEISTNIQTYVRYFCSIDDFAGVCCPDAAFPKATSA